MPVSSAENDDREFELSIQGGGNVEVGDPVTVAISYSDDEVLNDGWIDNQSFVVEDNGAGHEVTVDSLSPEDANWSDLDERSDLEQFFHDTRNTRPGPRRSIVPTSPSRTSSSTTSTSSVTSTFG